MKSIMKGKLLKKLKTIKPIGYLKPERFLHVNASDGYHFSESQPSKSSIETTIPAQTQKIFEEETNLVIETEEEPEVIDVSELMRDLEEDDIDTEFDEKENFQPEPEKKFREIGFGGRKIEPLSEIDVSDFRRPDLDSSGSLFDPNLLAAFEQAVMEVKAQEEADRIRSRVIIEDKENNQDFVNKDEEEPPLKARRIEEKENRDPLSEFEEKCPPGGSNSVILYTTGLRGIRKTFENCQSIRFLLENFRVMFYERDISMHSEFREELWRIMGEKLVPPCLFIRGRYIGGAEKVLVLHEQGKLRPLFEGVPRDRSVGPCEGCGGARFMVCFSCNGSRKVAVFDDVAVPEICPECNENGLIICPLCC